MFIYGTAGDEIESSSHDICLHRQTSQLIMVDSVEKASQGNSAEDEKDEKLPEEGGFNDYLVSYLSCAP